MKVGFYGGKFMPFHQGHLYSTLKASAMVDKLYVIVLYDEERDRKLCEQGNMPYMPYKERALWISQETRDCPNIEILYIEDADSLDADYNWLEGGKRIKAAIHESITHVFSSESSYSKWFDQIYPEAEHIVLDEARQMFPISATQIRTEGVYKHWDMLPMSVRPFFTKKVAVVGTESCGKSTLVRNLAKLFQTTYVEEYGRTICEEIGNGSDLIIDRHYEEITYGHKHLEFQRLKQANKVLFIDSEQVVTQYYTKVYQGYELPIVEEAIATQRYDLYLYLEPDVPWVEDGYRVLGETSVRASNNALLKEMFAQRHIPIITIEGTYNERMEQAIQHVRALIAI
ncbi:multifunctional transcriptional regulator/nicotinamide-nucleotide adenylyltransferase/ribosylnicotinamide kinase NadR [Metasolibacillus meyeri]|uniref:Multifunctional transcriptional regulator/nicotinamide-nucleotide adenylyltransferase/ribosylnicotinamide kinase NadR n=1 Tax=Metasolibacillus meyeri TaxID=1071052 RepID=A0AAW9NRL2_9BACL|nr:multifunctional transcriptional regulator/nicotinamide-nucleotide adenylyltransferase/ribosylnicotinamide kinase NadR [Metasolibacillus meyeri]MEC1177513.1 multifunctional transcriptional regulator/nicotinamide-nucleotide adenylyltransferase/ribosylnicotinamide kinase NadR [Metasolibacillus meyeri]